MFDSLNKFRKTVMDGVDTSEMEFKPLKDFCGKVVNVNGFFFTDGKFGKQVVVVGNGYLINMPQRAVESFEEIESDEDMLNAVLDGKLAIRDIHMIDTKNGVTVAYKFADIQNLVNKIWVGGNIHPYFFREEERYA